jgi:long-chain acyl-CoA synthetase
MSETSKPFLGIISGERRHTHDEVAARAARIAGGLHKLGVRQGDCVCILMRNDIAFVEAAYAAMRLGAYGVPVNWHFKPEEINYILKDSGTSVLIAHADMLHDLRDAIPPGVTALSVPTPPEILAHYKIDPGRLAKPDFALDFESWLARQVPYDGPTVPQPSNMIYTSGTTGHPKGVRRSAPTPEQTAAAERMARRRAGADAAFRPRGIPAPDRAGADRHHVHGADHVHPPVEAAGASPQQV